MAWCAAAARAQCLVLPVLSSAYPHTLHFQPDARNTFILITSSRIHFRASSSCSPLQEYVAGLEDSGPIVFVVGAFAHGKIEAPWVDEELNISEYPLSAAYCLARITQAFEMKWKIV